MPEDIPAWQISFMRRLIRICNQPGQYIVFIDVAWDKDRTWTYSVSTEHPLLSNFQEKRDRDE
jgi:hypothetical protein